MRCYSVGIHSCTVYFRNHTWDMFRPLRLEPHM